MSAAEKKSEISETEVTEKGTPAQSRPSIFNYQDYRAFLKDFYLFLKSTQSFFSYRYFSKKAGYQAPNFLKLVIEGKRNLSTESIERFSGALKLTRDETHYFKNLVNFNQADSSAEKAEAASRLSRSRFSRELFPLRESQFNLYSKWYLIPIRELVGVQQFNGDPAWIAERMTPRISVEEARSALDELLSLGLIEKTESGSFRQVTSNVTTDDEVSSASVVLFHREMLAKASESIDRFAREEREISCVTVSVSSEKASVIKQMIHDFKREVLKVAHSPEDAEQVYQINFQLFPLSKKSNQGEA